MKTVHEVSELAGVSVRTLHHYDAIGLLKPAKVTGAGYRLYDDAALERLQQILLFRALEFPLKDIRTILDSPNFDRGKALDQQIQLLMMKKEHLEGLIDLARKIKTTGVRVMEFAAFDTGRLDRYAAQAKAAYGQTSEYREFEEKSRGRSPEEAQRLNQELMGIFGEFGNLRQSGPESPEAQCLVEKLQAFISEHFYRCSDQVLLSMGGSYAGGGEMNDNIDRAGGPGTGAFVCQAIQAHCGRAE